MGKKTEKLKRVVQKLSKRYGVDDENVQRLQAELIFLESLEVSRPERRTYGAQHFSFQTPAKQLYFAAAEHLRH